MRRHRWPTALLIWLGCLLPLLALLCAQFAAYCDDNGGCSVPVRVGGWLTWPLIVAWVATMAALVWRLVAAVRRQQLHRRQE